MIKLGKLGGESRKEEETELQRNIALRIIRTLCHFFI